MALSCRLLQRRFDQPKSLRDIAALLIPFSDDLCATTELWSTSSRRDLASTNSDPLIKGFRMGDYIKWIKDKYFYLMPTDQERLQFLAKRSTLGLTPEQALVVTMLIGGRRCIGFDTNLPTPQIPVDLLWHFNTLNENWLVRVNFHVVGEEELWSFMMNIQHEPLWPKELWRGGEQDQGVYVVSYVLQSSGNVFSNSFVVDGAWNISTTQLFPFTLLIGDVFSIQSLGRDLFPLQITCIDQLLDVRVRFQITTDQPPYLGPTNPYLSAGNGSQQMQWSRVSVIEGSVELKTAVYQMDNGVGNLTHQYGGEACQYTGNNGFVNAVRVFDSASSSSSLSSEFHLVFFFDDGQEWYILTTGFPHVSVYTNDGQLLDGQLNVNEDWTQGVLEVEGNSYAISSDHPFQTHQLESGLRYFDLGLSITGGSGFMFYHNYSEQVPLLLTVLNVQNPQDIQHLFSRYTSYNTSTAAGVLFWFTCALVILFIILVVLKQKKIICT